MPWEHTAGPNLLWSKYKLWGPFIREVVNSWDNVILTRENLKDKKRAKNRIPSNGSQQRRQTRSQKRQEKSS